jgi:alpha-N-acetylglucosamine transferase
MARPKKTPVKAQEHKDVYVTFLQVGNDTRLAEKMVASVKQVMPEAKVIQMSDVESPLVKGADAVIRMPYDGYLMTFRLKHLAELRGRWITLDTDIIVKKDLRHVFDQPFDVALTKREGVILDGDNINIAAMMPYNAGVMFSTSYIFWQNAVKTLVKMPESAHKWWGDQLALRMMVDCGKFDVLELPCDEYNYSPSKETERKDVYVYHFKGKRKDWMLNGNY